MRSTAYIHNVTRGVIDHEALVQALREGELAGAGLDVTEPEPLPAGHPVADAQRPTPHASGHSPHSGRRMFDLLRENCCRQPGSPCSTWWTSASAPEPSALSAQPGGHPGERSGVERPLPGSYYPRTGAERGADWRGCEQHDRKDRGRGTRGTRERLLKSGGRPGRGGSHRAEGASGGGRDHGGRRLAVYIGTGGRGIHFLRLDRSTGLLTFVETTEAPTDGWITFDPAQRALYAASATTGWPGSASTSPAGA